MVFIERPVPGISKTKPAHKNGNGNRPELKNALQKEISPAVALSEITKTADGPALWAEDIIFPEGNPPDILNSQVVILEKFGEIQDQFLSDGSFGEAESSIAENGAMKSPPSISSEIVNRAKEGDGEALTEIYQQLFPKVYRYVLARTGSTELAEDLTQDVFENSLLHLDKYQERPETPFTAWIFRIAHNCVISYRRKETTRWRNMTDKEIPESLASNHDVEEEVEINSELERAREAIRKLSKFQRKVMELRFISGLNVKETAEAMGKGKVNVKVIQHKAIIRLRELLGAKPWLVRHNDSSSSKVAEHT